MKVILTGSTGFIGGAVLKACLANPLITSIVAFTRGGRLPPHPKLIDINIAAFDYDITSDTTLPFEVPGVEKRMSYLDADGITMQYLYSVQRLIEGADACIWCMGTYNWDKTVEVEYPAAFYQVIECEKRSKEVEKPFRYVYLGGAFTEPDQERKLWLLSEGRHVRGLAQTQALDFGREYKKLGVESYVVRPAGVIAADNVLTNTLSNVSRTIAVSRLAAVMVDVAINGWAEEIISNSLIISRGKELAATK